MTDTDPMQSLAEELYCFLASRFPVCCESDEFVYFPQVIGKEPDWSAWDDLSPDSVEDAVLALRGFQTKLDHAVRTSGGESSGGDGLASLVRWTARNLEEQFTLVKTHSTQPTFVLTIATVGLVQALQSDEPDAFERRLDGLPGFLDRALHSMSRIPELYRDLGIHMVGELSNWLVTLEHRSCVAAALKALDGFARRLLEISSVEDFRLSGDLFQRVVEVHTGSGLSLHEALGQLEEEAALTGDLLREESGKLGYGGDWETAYASVPADRLPARGKEELLRLEIERLRHHCLDHGFLSLPESSCENLVIEKLPPSLMPVRAADSYNARPGFPYKGGVFYIFGGGTLGDAGAAVHPVYRMTAAHEAFPGHHLLDCSRWNNPLPALRHIEYPLFYEGWACFGEDLMLETGAFGRPYDRLILLRRRFRHAVRGKVDLKLHSGELQLSEAALELRVAGFTPERAEETVKKYALRPAYQMCYTIGRRHFWRLFESFGKRDVSGFVNTILTQGELLFEDLERVFKLRAGRRAKGEDQPSDDS